MHAWRWVSVVALAVVLGGCARKELEACQARVRDLEEKVKGIEFVVYVNGREWRSFHGVTALEECQRQERVQHEAGGVDAICRQTH